MRLPIPVVAVDHVGIAAPDSGVHPLARAIGAGGLELTPMRSGVAIARFGPDERLELVVPDRPGSPIETFLERRGPGLHHIAFRVDEPLASLLPGLAAAGLEPAGQIEPSSDGRPSLFLHPRSTGGILVELVEGPGRT
jgi:methylmalonyl-CoA/ethylmalonyl-CoA epimerase